MYICVCVCVYTHNAPPAEAHTRAGSWGTTKGLDTTSSSSSASGQGYSSASGLSSAAAGLEVPTILNPTPYTLHPSVVKGHGGQVLRPSVVMSHSVKGHSVVNWWVEGGG